MARLGDVCTIVSGATPKTNCPEFWNGGIKWITPAELQADSDVVTDTERKITQKAVNNCGVTLFPKGTVLLSSRAPIGKVAIAGVEMCCNQGFKNLICSDAVYNRYLYWFLKGKNAYLNSLGRGATFKEISRSIVEDIEIPLPEKTVQHHIADVFDEVSKLILLHRKQLEQMDNLVKARFVELFGDVALNPNGYPIKNFDDISILITDGEHATPRRAEEGIYLLSARNVLNHTLQLDDVDYIDEDEYNRIARRVIPQAGDVLISCSGSIGRCCVVPKGLKFQMVRSAALIRFNETIHPIFAEWLITSDDLQNQIAQSATQSSQANLFQGKIKKLHGYVPPIELQNQFAAFVEQTNKSKVVVQKALDEVQTLFDSLMQQYFG